MMGRSLNEAICFRTSGVKAPAAADAPEKFTQFYKAQETNHYETVQTNSNLGKCFIHFSMSEILPMRTLGLTSFTMSIKL